MTEACMDGDLAAACAEVADRKIIQMAERAALPETLKLSRVECIAFESMLELNHAAELERKALLEKAGGIQAIMQARSHEVFGAVIEAHGYDPKAIDPMKIRINKSEGGIVLSGFEPRQAERRPPKA